MIRLRFKFHTIQCAKELTEEIHKAFGEKDLDITFDDSSASADIHSESCVHSRYDERAGVVSPLKKKSGLFETINTNKIDI